MNSLEASDDLGGAWWIGLRQRSKPDREDPILRKKLFFCLLRTQEPLYRSFEPASACGLLSAASVRQELQDKY